MFQAGGAGDNGDLIGLAVQVAGYVAGAIGGVSAWWMRYRAASSSEVNDLRGENRKLRAEAATDRAAWRAELEATRRSYDARIDELEARHDATVAELVQCEQVRVKQERELARYRSGGS